MKWRTVRMHSRQKAREYRKHSRCRYRSADSPLHSKMKVCVFTVEVPSIHGLHIALRMCILMDQFENDFLNLCVCVCMSLVLDKYRHLVSKPRRKWQIRKVIVVVRVIYSHAISRKMAASLWLPTWKFTNAGTSSTLKSVHALHQANQRSTFFS